MSKEEIKSLIAAKIAGQGTQVDLGGALPSILEAIVDAIPEGGGGKEPYIVQEVSVDDQNFDSPVLKVPAMEYARAKEAFLAGRVVLIPEINRIAYMVIAYSGAAVESRDGMTFEGLCIQAYDVSSSGACDALISQ